MKHSVVGVPVCGLLVNTYGSLRTYHSTAPVVTFFFIYTHFGYLQARGVWPGHDELSIYLGTSHLV